MATAKGSNGRRMSNGRVLLIRASDGADLARRARDVIARAEPSASIEESTAIPQPWERVVALFLASPAALTDNRLLRYAERLLKLGIPVVPVVERLDTYDFSAVPEPAEFVSARNAVGLEPENMLVEGIQGYLGTASFVKDRMVFISYRRSDGTKIAKQIYDYLWREHIPAFIDTFALEAGAVVQERIFEAIQGKDFVLLIDTPDASQSKWVMAELAEALAQRVPVGVVATTDDILTPLVGDMPRERWRASDARRLDRVRALVSRGIAAKASLDSRVERTLGEAARLKGLTVEHIATRQIILSKGRSRVMLEYENTGVSLERLHRLYSGYCRHRPCERALFVCGDRPLPEPTRDAVVWARRRSPLAVAPLPELYSLLDTHFPTRRT